MYNFLHSPGILFCVLSPFLDRRLYQILCNHLICHYWLLGWSFLRDYISFRNVCLCSYWNLIHFSQFPVCLLAYSLCTFNFSLRFLGWRALTHRHLLPTLIHRQVYLSSLPYLLYAWAWWASCHPYRWLYHLFCRLEHASFIAYLFVQSHRGFPSTS